MRSHAYVIGGVLFHVAESLPELDDDGYTDLDIHVVFGDPSSIPSDDAVHLAGPDGFRSPLIVRQTSASSPTATATHPLERGS
ncbi:MAG: hypothetical protein R2706_07620 [Acidimicrobiales bacterium]